MYADLLVFSMFADVITYHWYMIRLFALGMKIRVACCSLIYRKYLKQRIGEGLNGSKIINLPSNDANRFDLALLVILFVWVTPVLMLVEIFYLYFAVDSIATAGVVVLVLSLLFES
jgi:ATP-binding cassette subfamily C (CFTR/MRP) protein 4